MPTYEYACQDCRKQFALVLSIAEHDRGKVTCPRCKGRKVRQVLSPFIAKTSRKS